MAKKLVYGTVEIDNVTDISANIDFADMQAQAGDAELSLIHLPDGAVPLSIIVQRPSEDDPDPPDILAFYIPVSS